MDMLSQNASTPLPSLPAPVAQKPRPTSTLSFPLPRNLILSPSDSDSDSATNTPPLSPSLSISSSGSSALSDSEEVDFSDLDLQNGAAQLRDRHHRASPILRTGSRRVRDLCGAEQGQLVREERGEGSGGGRGMITAARHGASSKIEGGHVEEPDGGSVTRRRSAKQKSHVRSRLKVRFALPEPAVMIADQSMEPRECDQQRQHSAEVDQVHDAALKAFKHKISLLSSPAPPAAPPPPKASNIMLSDATSKDGWHRRKDRVVSGDPSAPANQGGAFPMRYSYLTESWQTHANIAAAATPATTGRRVSDRVRGDDGGWSWF
ncbi:uncharacterized protein AB675_9056 [Cyphellophora attinorum]|uniref:Uncharacterized protein n=1 Tax=Cyphellophora attinorum TaxID=1664694 RepID=A0A0N1HS74_9EURO|nr:uncharacterized protein AB675_9056 [Phialophora attinorum]KPI41385.1 hypothetical protein AB675_9056 [Phialophora attinorum]